MVFNNALIIETQQILCEANTIIAKIREQFKLYLF